MQSPHINATNNDAGMSALDLNDHVFVLNPNAPAFVPSYHVDDQEAEKIDDIMKLVNHLASVNDTETLLEAKEWLGAEPDEWLANGAEYTANRADGALGRLYEQEAMMLDGLHMAPQKAKGNTAGRARAH